MQQNWHIRSRAHACAVTQRPFEDGEVFQRASELNPALVHAPSSLVSAPLVAGERPPVSPAC